MAIETLLQPARLGAIRLPNRIVAAPMTRRRASDLGVPLEIVVEHYAQRASAGLLITEATAISERARGLANAPGIFNAAQVEGWRRVVAAVHSRGGRIVMQLAHYGRNSLTRLMPTGATPSAPSAIVATSTSMSREPPAMPHEMSAQEIASTIEEFAVAAGRAMDAGFDGVELQAGSGHLIDQFLHDGSNTRIDTFGGSFANRTRFLLEIIKKVSATTGRDRTGVRLSPFGRLGGIRDSRPLQLFTHVVHALDECEIGYLHLLEARASEIETHDQIQQNGLNNAKLFRPLFRGPLLTAGGYDPVSASIVIEDGNANAVAFGRYYVSNPDLVARIANRWPLNPFDRSTFYEGGARGYIDYPAYSG